jgi:hypothetical protein
VSTTRKRSTPANKELQAFPLSGTEVANLLRKGLAVFQETLGDAPISPRAMNILAAADDFEAADRKKRRRKP